jgi:hypothetical protein
MGLRVPLRVETVSLKVSTVGRIPMVARTCEGPLSPRGSARPERRRGLFFSVRRKSSSENWTFKTHVRPWP